MPFGARIRPFLLALVLSALIGGVSACADRSQAAEQASPAQRELRVAAASSLRSVLESIAPAFESEHDVKLVFDFGSSGQLQKQVEAGAPLDVFASASPKQIDALIEGGFVSAESTATFAGNELVILVPKGNPASIDGPAGLERAERIATGDPETAPHGAKAREWLEGVGRWDALKPRFVFAENAAQTLDYVARGEVDAAIGFASEASNRGDVEVAYTVPAEAITPIRYVAAPIAGAKDAALADAFVEYLTSPAAEAAFAHAGFTAAPTTTP